MFIEANLIDSIDARIGAFAQSDVFERLFHEGMDLVSETANYLDGEGRAQSRNLDRSAALTYASESMRLTTRLMQASSWLLIQRAVREGEMKPRQALDSKYRLGARRICLGVGDHHEDVLPPFLIDLLDRSLRLYERIDRLDNNLIAQSEEVVIANPVSDQMARLKEAMNF